MSHIGLIDYGAGNFTSVRNALEYLGLEHSGVRTSEEFDRADRMILPGVGAFPAAMRQLKGQGLDQLILEHVDRGKAILGICVGMQMLAQCGHEFEFTEGLGLIEGEVRRIEARDLPVPHIGWNELSIQDEQLLFGKMENEPSFYFVHSFHLLPEDQKVVTARCVYGGDVVASVRQGSVYGVQFHPEKSQHNGLQLLKNFSTLTAIES